MRTKFYLAALALPAIFASCQQDEWAETGPAVENAVANRPVAGVVTIKTTTDDVDTRFNYEKADGFEVDKDDVFGFYLMDVFDGSFNGLNRNECAGEHEDANYGAEKNEAGHSLWEYQDHWNAMYQFSNSITSNYPFKYVTNENGEKVWKNDAKLVEGNYFAMFPQNEKALNRRALWKYIEPAVDMKPVSTAGDVKKFQYVENQFWLGYKQIYRDAVASAEGELEVDIKMRGVMVPLRINLLGWQGNDVKLDKISIKDAGGKALPTLAYIEPATYLGGNWKKYDEEAYYETVGCDNVKHGLGLYDESATWTKLTVQNLVRWAVPGVDSNTSGTGESNEGRYPYGLEEYQKAPAYEYSFSFPEGTQLNGDVRNGDQVIAYIAVPALNEEAWKSLQVTVYGWRLIKGATGEYWEYGLLTSQANPNVNYTFILNQQVNAWLNQAEESSYYRDVEVRFDNLAWTAANKDIIVASTEDMEKMVKANLTEIKNTDAKLTVLPSANGIQVRKEFIDYLEGVSAREGRSITINFSGNRQGKVFFTENETMDVAVQTTETGKALRFNYVDGIQLVNSATQTIDNELNNTVDWSNAGIVNTGLITSEKPWKVNTFSNEGAGALYVKDVLTLTSSAYNALHNLNLVTLAANVNGSIKNDKTLDVVKDVTVTGSILNKNECVECGKTPAEITVDADGSLEITATLTNYGNVKADGSLSVVTEVFNNEGSIELNAESSIKDLTNKAALTVNDLLKLTGTSDNYATIAVNKGAEISAYIGAATLNNIPKATITVTDGKLSENIMNSGLIEVIGDAQVIVNGVMPGNLNGIIDVTKANGTSSARAAKDNSVGNNGNHFLYTVTTNLTNTDLVAKLEDRISSKNINENFITVIFDNANGLTYKGVMSTNYQILHVVVAEGTTLTLTGNTAFQTLSNTCATQEFYKAFEIEEGANLTVDDSYSLTLNNDVIVYVNGELKANDHSKLVNKTVKIAGDGELWINTAATNVEWTLDSRWAGNTHGFTF